MPTLNSLTWLAVPALLYGCAEIQKPALEDVACLGHRGFVTETTLENTIEAFQAAYNLGADGTELDIFHTRDNVAVVFHDQTLERLAQSKPGETCPLDQGIADFSLAELNQQCQLINGDDIPTLESVLLPFTETDFRFYIEFKDPIHADTLALLKRLYPDPDNRLQATSFLKDTLTPLSVEGTVHFPLILAHKQYIPGMEYGFDGVDVAAISTEDIRRLHHAGKRIGLYGLNEAPDIRRALDERVHYITTDTLPLCLELKQEALSAQG